MKKVYKIFVLKKMRRNISNCRGFWKYFYSLSDLAKYMSESPVGILFFPMLESSLSKEELNILNSKLTSNTCIDMVEDTGLKEYLRSLRNRY